MLELLCSPHQVESEFILESERESFIEQVREVIEMADEKGEGMKEGFTQVYSPPYGISVADTQNVSCFPLVGTLKADFVFWSSDK